VNPDPLVPIEFYALYSRLSQLFTDAVHDGLVVRNPCSRRTSPGMGRQRAYVATTQQVWALYDAVPPGVRPAILLGAHAGLRLAEAAGLRVEDIDFATGVISPSVQWVDEPLKSETSRRSIPIPRDMAHLLAEAVRLGNGTHIVSDQWGDPAGPWMIKRAVRAARTQVGLSGEFRFHDLRRYFASLLIASGLDVKVVQARFRHASAKTTSTITATSGPTVTTPPEQRWRRCIASDLQAAHTAVDGSVLGMRSASKSPVGRPRARAPRLDTRSCGAAPIVFEGLRHAHSGTGGKFGLMYLFTKEPFDSAAISWS